MIKRTKKPARKRKATRINRNKNSKTNIKKFKRRTKFSRFFLSSSFRRLYLVLFMIIIVLLTKTLVNDIDRLLNENNEYKVEARNSFIDSIDDSAVEQYGKTGVLPSIVIAQAILESNWGESQLSVKGYNLFGIKADKSWNGPKIRFMTKENYNDQITADFRKYESWDDSIIDHGRFLTENKRYRSYGMFDSKDYILQAQALENAGYSTIKNSKGQAIYARSLINVIEKYKLFEYDKRAISIYG